MEYKWEADSNYPDGRRWRLNGYVDGKKQFEIGRIFRIISDNYVSACNHLTNFDRNFPTFQEAGRALEQACGIDR